MEFWEFLLQKDGDRSWLPLESTDVEILEGRYRVVARTSRPNTSVEIRITHLATDEMPPKRRVQKRSHQTNKDGLMIIFPFTRLKPGTWEVRCSADVMANLLGEAWQHTVRLQVASAHTEGAGDWEPDWQAGIREPEAEPVAAPEAAVPEAVEPVAAPEPEAEPEAEPESVVAPTVTSEPQLPILKATPPAAIEAAPTNPVDVPPSPAPSEPPVVSRPVLPELPPIAARTPAPIAPEPAPEPASAPTSEPDVSLPIPEVGEREPHLPTLPGLQIHLEEEHCMASWGQPFALAGQIQMQLPEQTPEVGVPSRSVELQIYLRDPQNLQVLVDLHNTLTLRSAVTPFTCMVLVPASCKPQLLLGEINLYPIEADAEPSLTVLASQSFTVTAAPEELLSALNRSQQPDVEAADETAEASPTPAPPSLNLAFLELIDTPKAEPTFKPADRQPIPPQLYRPDPEKTPARSLELPPIQRPQPPQPELPALESTPESTLPALPEAPDQAEVPPSSDRLESDPDPSVSEPVQLPLIAAESSVTTPLSFESLKLQERFFTRLTALATDEELSSLLKATLPEPLVMEQEDRDEPSEIASDQGVSLPEASVTGSELALVPPPDPEERWAAHEIVVEDDPAELTSALANTPAEWVEAALVLEDEPLPQPELDVPEGELIAGSSIHVRVRIPMSPHRLYAKFWVTDRQTLSVIDGPRSLMALTPNGFGALESTILLSVPLGSLEISIEAITIEMQSQRESHKTTVYRMIIPPDLPTFSLEGLE